MIARLFDRIRICKDERKRAKRLHELQLHRATLRIQSLEWQIAALHAELTLWRTGLLIKQVDTTLDDMLTMPRAKLIQ